MRVAALFFLGLMSTAALPDAYDDVRCHEIAFSNAAEERDALRFRSFIDEDARFVGTRVSRGPEEIVAAWQPFFEEGGPAIRWRPQFVEVLENGRLALTRGPYRLTTKDEDGNPVERWGTFNSVWRLHKNGEWKVVFDAGSPAAEPPSDEIQGLLELETACD